ncbi:MAG: inositol-3-phosphate synthase, partial [Acidobacteriota bacterium]
MTKRKLGIAVIGLGGAVGTTMVAGLELLRKRKIDTQGLPLAELDIAGLAAYEDILIGGWDVYGSHLANAAEEHDVLTHRQFVAVESELRQIKPWPGVGNSEFVTNIAGENQISAGDHRG